MNLIDLPNPPIVYDLGSAMFRAGFAGSAFPEINTPCSAISTGDENISYIIDEHKLYSKPLNNNIVHLIDEQGNFSYPNLLSDFLKYSHSRLNITDTSEVSALFSQPAHLLVDPDFGREWRKCIAQNAFEVMNYSHVSITSDALLAAYAHCYYTATVVDFGWSCTRIIPIIEGQPMISCSKFHICGGMILTNLLADRLRQKGVVISDNGKGLSKKQMSMNEDRIYSDVLKQVLTLYDTPEGNESQEVVAFIDGRNVDVKNDVDVLSKIIWNKITPNGEDGSTDIIPVQELLKDAIYESPDQNKRELWSSIVTSGGFSKIRGFQSKLIADLKGDKSFQRKVHFPMHELITGDFCNWTGGSILASSPVFDRYSVSKGDYAEYGEDLIRIKCETHR